MEFPIMPEVRKLDSRRRAVFPDRFSPGDLFLEEEIAGNRVVFRLIQAAEAPLATVEAVGGMLMVCTKADSQVIRDAIRADREAR